MEVQYYNYQIIIVTINNFYIKNPENPAQQIQLFQEMDVQGVDITAAGVRFLCFCF
jgi:hypothetical protein